MYIYTMHNVQCTCVSIQCTVYSVQCTVSCTRIVYSVYLFYVGSFERRREVP